jgi:hypothetical protein
LSSWRRQFENRPWTVIDAACGRGEPLVMDANHLISEAPYLASVRRRVCGAGGMVSKGLGLAEQDSAAT